MARSTGFTRRRQPGGGRQVRPTSPIYLLVGRRDEVVDPGTSTPWATPARNATNTTCNVYDFNSFGLRINSSTGLIVVTDNCGYSGTPA